MPFYDILFLQVSDDMKAKRKPMTWIQKVLYFICFTFLIVAFIYLGTRNYHVKELPDNELFYRDYPNVGLDNSYQVLSAVETLSLLSNGTGVIFFGFPENSWSGMVAEMLNEASKEVDYPVISYFNFYDERESYNENYKDILQKLSDYLVLDDMGTKRLYAPTVVGVINGKIIYYDAETTFVKNKMSVEDYWTTEKKDAKIEDYKAVFEQLKGVLKK